MNVCQMAHRHDGCPRVALEVNCPPRLYLGRGAVQGGEMFLGICTIASL